MGDAAILLSMLAVGVYGVLGMGCDFPTDTWRYGLNLCCEHQAFKESLGEENKKNKKKKKKWANLTAVAACMPHHLSSVCSVARLEGGEHVLCRKVCCNMGCMQDAAQCSKHANQTADADDDSEVERKFCKGMWKGKVGRQELKGKS